MTAFENLTSASMQAAREIRVVTITEEEIFQRAREGFIFAHPKCPMFVRRFVRSGRADAFLASARQVIRDIEKPVDFLTHEARAAWVLNAHSSLMHGMDNRTREAVAQIAITAVRVGTKDAGAPCASTNFGPALMGLTGVVLAIVALVMVL